jgi:hypothetical protein
MEDYKIYTGKEFNNQNKSEFIVFSKNVDIETKKIKKPRFKNDKIKIYDTNSIIYFLDQFFFRRLNWELYKIYKVKILDDTVVLLEKKSNNFYVKGNFKLIYWETFNEYLLKYQNCLNLIKNGLKNMAIIPEKNKTYELILEAVKMNNINIENLNNYIEEEFKTYELFMEIVKKERISVHSVKYHQR